MTRRDFLGTAAAAPAAAQMQTPETGFTTLFDGQTLRGWNVVDGPESAFYVDDGAIVVHQGGNFPCWLRSERQYENFDFRGEYFIRGWMDSGIYMHAPEHGRPIWNGMQFHLFHNNQETPQVSSNGAILPVAPPLKINVRNKGEWNDFRLLMDWPKFQAWTNGELVQDLDLEQHPELRYRFRRGYLGFMSLSYPIRFRNLRVRELPDKEKWQVLYGGPADFDKWTLTEGGKAKFEALGPVLRCDGNGSFATREKFKDFELRLYVRHDRHHNSGVLFRTGGDGLKSKQYYEIQLHDVEGAHYPTGSLYHRKRAVYPRIEAYQWWPMHVIVKGAYVFVRINGDTVLEYEGLDYLEEGPIELQAHSPGRWTEFKDVRIKRL
jgi:hypothetical protein